VRSSGFTFDYQPNSEMALDWMRQHWSTLEEWEYRGISVVLFDTKADTG
jgi:hypothetical protein